MQVYKVQPYSSELNVLIEDYIRLLKRSLKQDVFGKASYTNEYLRNISSILDNYSFENITIKNHSVYYDSEYVDFSYTITNDDYSDLFRVTLKKEDFSNYKLFFQKVKGSIYRAFQVNSNYAISHSTPQEPEDLLKNTESLLKIYQRLMEDVEAFLLKNKSKIVLNFFLFYKLLSRDFLSIRARRIRKIRDLERCLNSKFAKIEPKPGEKVLVGKDIMPFRIEGCSSMRFYPFCTYLYKKDDFYYLQDPTSNKKKRVKYIKRYLPNIEELKELQDIVEEYLKLA